MGSRCPELRWVDEMRLTTPDLYPFRGRELLPGQELGLLGGPFQDASARSRVSMQWAPNVWSLQDPALKVA